MQNTTNFNFNLPEGTDLWNYLTQTNPNFTALDSILKSVQDGTVTTATEVTSGTAHAVTRTLPDANVIRFTATGVWTLGDTMTIDGTPVTVVKPNGTSLQTGDYIIGSEVLGVLRATQFTVYVGGASSMDAEDVDYDNTVSGLTATDVQAAIDEEAAAINTINSNLSEQSISLSPTTTGNDVSTIIGTSLLKNFTPYVTFNDRFRLPLVYANQSAVTPSYIFSGVLVVSGSAQLFSLQIYTSTDVYVSAGGATPTLYSSSNMVLHYKA